MEHGSLNFYVKSNDVFESSLIRFGTEVASGMCYLSAKGLVHRDLATRNVLLNSELKAKISDFGMSRDTSDSNNYYRSKGGNLPV